MRTEGYRRGLSCILLVSVIVLSMTFSMIFTDTLVLADAVISYPGHPSQPQNIFDVPQGQTFTLRHRMAWDEPGVPGYYLVVIYWDYFGANARHFTLDSVIAYFDNDGDNLPDPGVALIDNTVKTRDNGTRYVIGVSNAPGNDNDGIFNVDITLRAAGPDGTPHAATDNHPIYYTIVQSLESIPPSITVPLVTVRVLGRGVAVSISPSYQSGEPGVTLSYAVTVNNLGIVEDNYDLTVSDNAGWGPSLSENRIENVAPGENRVTTLNVTIPSDALGGLEDTVTVTAISQGDPTMSDLGSCVVHVFGPGVAISISPSYKGGPLGTTLGFTVTITNTGTVGDTYELTISDNENWELSLSENWFENVAPDENRTATLNVTVPENAVPSTEDKITVIATSQANPSVSDFAMCTAHAEEVRREVEVSISPSYQSALAGTTLSYTVIIRNTGNVLDNYSLSVNDNAAPSWGPMLSENRLENVPPNEATTITLNVTIPEDAVPSTEDNITVTAISQGDPNVSNFAMCTAHAEEVRREVEVSISPSYQSALAGTTLSYTVIVKNTGNVEDNYSLNVNDNAGWNPTLSENQLANIGPGGNRVITLSVTVPENATSFDDDNITVTAISQSDPTVSDYGSCVIDVVEWTGGVIVRGKANSWTIYQGGILPYEWYTAGDNPPIMVAQRVDSGAFVAGGISSSCRNYRWNDTSPNNPYKGLDNLLDAAFQWMVPGADNVLWYENSVYNTTFMCSQLVANLVALGYDVDATSENLTPALLADYDILVINQLQRGTGSWGGDPSDPDILSWIPTIETWVRGGGGLLITDGGDYGGYNYCRVHNAILDALDSQWWFQHDQVSDDVDNWGATYEIVTDVMTDTTIGAAYETVTGWDDVGLYSVCSLIETPVTFAVDVTVAPGLRSGPEDADFTYTATINNTGPSNDRFALSVSDSAGWENVSISPSYLDIATGGSDTATVTVSVPIDTPYCTYDTLTVTATSLTDNTVSDSGTAQAHSSGVPAGPPPVGPPPYAVDVTITPWIQNTPPGGTLTYTVTVQNIGSETDSYNLSVTDTKSWGPSISQTLFTNLQYGESRTTTLTVTIPIGTPYCTYDTLTVTATSLADNTVSNSGTAQAHSVGWWPILRDVTVDIEPDHQEAELVIDRDAVKKRYDPLTFKVIVTNTGLLWDKYIITASTDSDKILELWPTELFLQPGQSDFVVLSVTVPEDEVGSTLNYILVEAVGTFATGTGDDIGNAAAFDICTVHVAEARCVRLDVWPFQVQSATPGSKVRWIARVKNLGNVSNTYMIEATNVVVDANRVYDPALITVEPYIVELPPCNWEQVIIDLEVPEDLEMSTRIYVTVTVQSLEYQDCYDEAEVEVHVVRGIPPIPQGVIKLEVETEIIAIQVWPTYWNFSVLDEAEIAETTGGTFTVRNIGNTPVDVTIAGNDAYSSPGELTTTWLLDDLGNVGLDRYAMWYGLPPSVVLTKVPTPLMSDLVPSEERPFDIKIQAPSSITVPSRMWTIVTLTAVES